MVSYHSLNLLYLLFFIHAMLTNNSIYYELISVRYFDLSIFLSFLNRLSIYELVYLQNLNKIVRHPLSIFSGARLSDVY
jgi:hypothetical protein